MYETSRSYVTWVMIGYTWFRADLVEAVQQTKNGSKIITSSGTAHYVEYPPMEVLKRLNNDSDG